MLSEKPWKRMDFLVVTALLSLLLLGGILSHLFSKAPADVPVDVQSQVVSFGITLFLYGAILVLVHLLVRSRGTSWRKAFGFESPRQLSALFLAVGVTFIVLPIAWYLGNLSVGVMERLRLKAVPQPSVQMLQTSASFGPQIFLAILAIVVAPVTEELLFRGILYPFIKQQGYPKLALWGTAVLFGVLHLNLMTFVPLTFLGLVLAWLYETTDDLLAPIFAHGLFNLANFFQVILENQSLGVVLFLLLCGVLLALLAYRLFPSGR